MFDQVLNTLLTDHAMNVIITAQPAFTCSKLAIKILEQGVKYVQS